MLMNPWMKASAGAEPSEHDIIYRYDCETGLFREVEKTETETETKPQA